MLFSDHLSQNSSEFYSVSSKWQFQIPCWCDNFPCVVSAIQHFFFLSSFFRYSPPPPHVLAHAINLKIYTRIGDPHFQWWWNVQNTPDVDIHYQYTLKYFVNVCMRAGKGEILKMLYHDCKHCTSHPLPLTRELNSRIMIISKTFLLSFAPV